jgi:hypothetical protein
MRRVILSLTVSVMALAIASGVALAQVVTCPTERTACVSARSKTIP